MNKSNINKALDVIGEQIQKYELCAVDIYDPLYGIDIIKEETQKRYSNAVVVALEVLSTLTGYAYHWTRRDLADGTLYSGIIKVTDLATGAGEDLTINYAK